MSLYELAILGAATTSDRDTLIATLGEMVAEFGLELGSEVLVHNASSLGGRDKRAAFTAVYFGGVGYPDLDEVRELVHTSSPIIPFLGLGDDFAAVVPDCLLSFNGQRRRVDDPAMTELATSLLECVGLLRHQRRVFISYRRVESRSAALQIHDLLTARGFDVFLDTHDIRPGDPFQDVLWHRLVDSDIMVMLDTPTYFESKWTRQEFGRARAKDIQVLRIVWPDHQPSNLTDLAETIYLDASSLLGNDGPIQEALANSILLRVEHLRSRSIAARYLSIIGKLRADIEKIGGHIEGVGASRAIALRLPDDRRIWAYPIVGVPTAEIFNDVAEKALRENQCEIPVVVYDHLGIRDSWSAHLKWLDEHIRAVRAIRVSDAGWILAAWEAYP